MRITALLGAVAALAVAAAPAAAATDTFNRTVSNGWGTADSGGSWTPESGAAQFAVASGQGTITLPTAGANREISLSGTAVDWDVTITARLDKTPTGGNVWLYHELRRTGNDAYRLQAKLASDGSTTLLGTRVVANSETAVGTAARVSGVDYRTGIMLRGQVVGTNPTTLRIKAWPVGGQEPSAWAYTATDSTGPQVAGRAGLRAYVSGSVTNAPITASLDDYAANATSSPPPPADDPVLVGAGDIATAGSNDAATAALVQGIPGTVFTLGDNDQGNGTAAEFAAYYDKTWGQFKARTLFPAPGNHEYNTSGASGYFGYFGAAAGDPGKGWYSHNVGAWHIIVLNANCWVVACDANSPQVTWLKSDLAANPTACTLAIWHEPLFTSGPHGPYTAVRPFWQALYNANADLVLNGHEHHYERFAPLSASGAADASRGIREIIVGTGGVGLSKFTGSIAANSVYRNDTSNGVLKLTLHAASYDWQFVRANGSNTDSGTGTCH
jgi:hypothetical protein